MHMAECYWKSFCLALFLFFWVFCLLLVLFLFVVCLFQQTFGFTQHSWPQVLGHPCSVRPGFQLTQWAFNGLIHWLFTLQSLCHQCLSMSCRQNIAVDERLCGQGGVYVSPLAAQTTRRKEECLPVHSGGGSM